MNAVYLNTTSVATDDFKRPFKTHEAWQFHTIYQDLMLRLWNEGILLGELNPQEESCHWSCIGIIKLFINLLKARVVTKPSSRDVAFVPYIDLAPRPNLHSSHIHIPSQFAWLSPTHWPHLPKYYVSVSSRLPNPSSWKTSFSNTEFLCKTSPNVKCCLKKLCHPIFLF